MKIDLGVFFNNPKPSLGRIFILMLLLSVALAQMPIQNAQAQAGTPQLILTKSIEDNLTVAQVGDVIRYRIRFECSSLTTACGQMEITDVLQNGLTYLPPPNSSVPAGFEINYNSGTRTITITKTDNNLLDGTQYDAVIAVRVNNNLRPLPAIINNTINGRIDPPGPVGWQNATPAPAPPIAIGAVSASWQLIKTRVAPVIEPTVNTDVTYRLQLCPVPPPSGGITDLTDIVITDTLPAGATFVSASNGGTYGGGIVTWPAIVGPLSPPTCAERYVVIRYPSPPFNVGDSLTNSANVTADYVNSSGNPCPDCFGPPTTNLTHEIDPIADVPTYSKDDSGDPVGITGTARFILNLNTNATNYPANNVTLIDNLPGELQVTSVMSGAWDASFDYVRAYVEYSTDGGDSWTAFPGQPVSYNTNATYTAPATNITNVRWRFEYDPDGNTVYTPGLPYVWQFTTNPEIRVVPRVTAATDDDGDPLPAASSGNTYDNCVQVTRANASGDVTDPCDIEPMTVSGDYVSLRVSKSETPGTPWNDLEDPNISTFTSDATILPGDTLRYILTVDMTERSSAPLVDPTIRDTLPDDLIFVRFGNVRLNNAALPGGATVTTTRSGPNPGTGQTLLWEFSGLTVNETPLGSNVLTVEFFARIPRGQLPRTRTNDLYVVTDSDDVYCEIGTQVNDATNGNVDSDSEDPDNACENSDTYVVERSAALRGEKWIRSVSTLNSVVVDKDSFLPDATCPNGGNSGIGASTNDFTRYPCISQAYPEGALNPGQYTSPPPGDADLDDFEYQLRVFNDGNVPMLNYFLYDILPYYGDKGSGGTLANSFRESEFRPVMTGPIQFLGGAGLVAGDFTIQYNLTTNPCRPEVFNTTGAVPAGCDNNWFLAAAIADWSTVRSYRIRLNSGETIAPYVEGDPTNTLRFGLPMSIPKDSPLVGAFNNDDAQSKEIAWNSLSHVGSYQDISSNIRDLLASEPRKVGITIPEMMSIGNRVWRDSDNSGTINAPDDTNPGIAGVTVNLYRDANNDGIPDGIPDGTAIASTTTDSDGFYLFSNIPYNSSDITQNRYIVGIPASNFNAGQPLNTLRSSTGTPATATYTNPPETNPDQSDHGRDPATPGQQVLSATITLQTTTEQTGETNLSNNDRDGIPGARRGVNGERDYNSDLLIDFGFFGGTDVPFSIGNYLWYDNGAGGGTVNDGIRQTVDTGLGTEPPVAGARVELYRDGNGNGRADPQEYIRFDVTDANGFYLFDNLDPGTYFVLVVPGNFTASFDPDGAGTAYSTAPGVLRGWYSSQVTGTENQTSSGQTTTAAIDSDDNGIDTHTPEINGVFSGPIVVTRDAAFPEPSGESHLSNEPDPGAPGNAAFNPTGWDGPNSRGRFLETDASSNLTVDFGFIPPMSLGNRVWIDNGAGEATFRAGYNNGLMDNTETGDGGVRMELWQDANGNGTLDSGEFIRYTTTDASGYYLFDRIQPGTNYYVHIPSSNFASGAPLENYISSYDLNQTTAPADDNEDRDDNGIDNGNIPATNGVTSPQIVMAYTTEPLTPGNETDISSNTVVYGTGNVGLFGQTDANSNLTMDFGFVQPPRSIGNRLWLDLGDGTGGVANDGIQNGTEGPVANARVSLYLDANADGQPDDRGVAGDYTDDWITWDATDTNGYYLFDNLPPNNYIVGVDRGNFATGVLLGYTSSTGNVDNASNDLDVRDNGVDRPYPTDATLSPYGILSTQINLTAKAITLPSGETGSGNILTALGNNPTAGDGPNSRGRYGETDTHSDLTIDFGFVEVYSLGNRVWYDADKDGTRNGSEVGLPNVPVNLYRDSNNNGIPDGGIIASTLTDANGFYRFDNLLADTYIVEVIPPVGYASTIDAGDADTNPNDDDDNGVVFVGSNVRSLPVTLEPGSVEPTGENNPTPNPDAANGESTDGRSNRTVDFGFIVSLATSNKRLTATTMMDTDPTTGDPAPGTDYTTLPEVVIGEILTYQTRLNIPSGATLTNLTARDQLDLGLGFVSCDSIDAPGLTTSLAGGFNDTCANPTVTPQTGDYNDATQTEFSLGDVSNNTADTQTLTITYRVIVLDIPSNVDGVSGLKNSIVWAWGGGSQLPVQSEPVQIVEPELSIDKRSTPRSTSYGSTIRFTIDIAHTSNSSIDAFDVTVTDQIPTGLTLDPASINVTGTASTPGNFTYDFDTVTNTLTVTWDVFPLGATGRITFNAVFVGPAPVINSANVAWSSLPIDPQPDGTPVPLSQFNDYSTERWYDPADLTGLNSYSRNDSVTIRLQVDEQNENPWVLPATGFTPNVVTKLPPMPADFAYAQTQITLEVPKFNQTLNIVGVPYDRTKREWNLTWLNMEAGWLENTAFPTHAGNSALTAHTTLSNGKPGPFAKLGALGYGDQIIVHLGGQKYIFEVRENKQVKPSAVKSTLKHEEYPWLTLITCKSYNEKTGNYAYRTVVHAVLVKVVDE